MFVLHPRVHGVVDYVIAALLFLLPLILGLPQKPAGFFYAMALLLVVIALCTDYPFGALKALPFTTHGVLELIVAVWLIIGPWMYRYTGTTGGDLSLILGIALFALWALTDHHETETREYHMRMHEHHQ